VFERCVGRFVVSDALFRYAEIRRDRDAVAEYYYGRTFLDVRL